VIVHESDGAGFIAGLSARTVPKTNSSASTDTGMVLIEISFFILVFIAIFSFFVETLAELPLKDTCTPITQLPDRLPTGSGKPHHLSHWQYLLTDLMAMMRK